MLESLGYLDTVTVENGRLRLEGWAGLLGAGTIDGFKVTCAGKDFTAKQVVKGLPSPDVKAAHPHLTAADNCRFRLEIPLSRQEEARAKASVIICTPLVREQECRSVVRLLEPQIATASEEDSLYIGGGFLAIGAEFLSYFIQFGGLRPRSDVLDVGCGCGRMAYVLAHYLDPVARYEGFDIVDRLIESAQSTIAARRPNFHFQKIDLHNKWYNPAGALHASTFSFPYEDASFDFVFLTSVFTHMLAPDVRHYLDEIQRVLRPGGRCLITCFLLTAEAEELIQEGKSTQDFVHPLEECFTSDPGHPENAIAYREPLLLEWVAQRGLAVVGKYPGSWCGRWRHTSYQDILVCAKAG